MMKKYPFHIFSIGIFFLIFNNSHAMTVSKDITREAKEQSFHFMIGDSKTAKLYTKMQEKVRVNGISYQYSKLNQVFFTCYITHYIPDIISLEFELPNFKKAILYYPALKNIGILENDKITIIEQNILIKTLDNFITKINTNTFDKKNIIYNDLISLFNLYKNITTPATPTLQNFIKLALEKFNQSGTSTQTVLFNTEQINAISSFLKGTISIDRLFTKFKQVKQEPQTKQTQPFLANSDAYLMTIPSESSNLEERPQKSKLDEKKAASAFSFPLFWKNNKNIFLGLGISGLALTLILLNYRHKLTSYLPQLFNH